jgi:hypothetical protein
MNKTMALSVLVLGTAFAGIACADTPVVNERQSVQRERIDEGVASGELTRREAAGLRAQQAHVRQEEREAKADGVVTRRERRHLQRELDRSSATIHDQKHDAQERR